MQEHHNAPASILSEADIRTTALDGANLVPRSECHVEECADALFRLNNLSDNLLHTINHPDLTGGHKTAACNLLCTVISRTTQSNIPAFRCLVWTESIWSRAFDVFLTQNHALSVKPLRQLLTTLTSALDKGRDDPIVQLENAAIVQKLAAIICSTAEHVPIRPAMQALAYFLRKNVTDSGHIFNAITDTQISPPRVDNVNAQHDILMETTLKWAPYDDYSSSAASLASAILENIKFQSPTQDSSKDAVLSFHSDRHVPWARPVLDRLLRDTPLIETYRNYVFPELFKHDLQHFVIFCETLGLHQILEGRQVETKLSTSIVQEHLENLLFCALSVGTKVGLVRVGVAAGNSKTSRAYLEDNALCIPDSLLGELILRSSSTIRVAGLSMLIASHSTTKPLSHGSIRALKNGLPYLHADADPGFRSEMFSLIRNLMDRIRGATASLYKLSKSHGTVRGKVLSVKNGGLQSDDASTLLLAHRSFMEWYLHFLSMELRPSASYQRHISAIKCILLVYRSGVDSRIPISMRAKTESSAVSWPFHLDVIDETLTNLLLDLLLDPFQDVRQGAAEILSIAPTTIQDQIEADGLVAVLCKAETMMMLSGRADHADGVAHLYNTMFARCSVDPAPHTPWWHSRIGVLEHLVTNLEETLEVAAKDINKAVSKHPLHGIFISLRYIMETSSFYSTMSKADLSALQSIHLRLYSSFSSVWSLVKQTLCNDVPQEYGSDELDEEEDIGTKDVLSYSWRALKEASLLLRAIVKSCPLNQTSCPLMTSQQLRHLGDLSFTQLAELRHRGAFSTVSQTFATCCMRCNAGSEVTSGALQGWYTQAILCIQNQTTINTRRSAGIPSLMVGIILADSIKGDLFQRAVGDLTTEATKPVKLGGNPDDGLSQVHAMNCLKDMFRNSKLGERSEAHVPEALGLAANCLSSDTWAIRNSGLMLFRALIDRLLGASETHTDNDSSPQSRLSFAAVPNLTGVILNLISPPMDTTVESLTEGVFPALQLLQRTPPPMEHRPAILAAVQRLTSSSQWHIRDKAAQTYAVLTAKRDRVAEASNLILSTFEGHNATHGVLLTVLHILESTWDDIDDDDLATILAALNKRSDALYHQSTCPYTKSAFVDIYSAWCQATLDKYYKQYPDLDRPLLTLKSRDDGLKLPLSSAIELDAQMNLTGNQFGAASALRQSLAHATLRESAILRFKDKAAPGHFNSLLRLASSDPDACTTMLQHALPLCRIQPRFYPLADLCSELLFHDDTLDLEVQAAAQGVLLTVLDSQSIYMRQDPQQLHKLLHLSATTPLQQDKRMVLQGVLLELGLNSRTACGDEGLSGNFQSWIASVTTALHEDNPYDTRHAAADAVSRIQTGLRVPADNEEGMYTASFLAYCTAVYNLTNDDDEDIRVLAAKAACNIISTLTPNKSCSSLLPLAASTRLAKAMAHHFKTSEDFCVTAMQFLTPRNEDVAAVLREARTQTPSLFMQEKQNLFVDEAREARLWSHVLITLSSCAFSAKQVRELNLFVQEGLDTLLTTDDDAPAAANGPLGWKRRSRVFVLGLRVVYAAEVLLDLRARSRGLLREMVSGEVIRGKLVVLLGQKGVYPLWKAEIEGILRRSVLKGVGRVARVVGEVSGQIMGD